MKDLNNIRIGITQGDINGIGYEIIMKALSESHVYEFCTPIVYGSPKVAAYHKKALNITNFSFNTIRNADEATVQKPYIVNCNDDNIRVELGKATPFSGASAFEALERATSEMAQKKFDVLVTAPINKHNIQQEGFAFPGHTEYLTKKFKEKDSLMLMVGDSLKVGVVTGHVPINQVASLITEEHVLSKLRILNNTLIEDFAIRKPIIAVLGLNPHAGDSGVIGDEEKNILLPLIQKARNEGIMALGPFPADGFFGTLNFKKFDAILAMYHDQGMVPFKLLNFENGVNFTAGLSIIRTSPAHGTAYEIAGKNEASEASMMRAIYLACDIYKNRITYRKLKANAISEDEIKAIISVVKGGTEDVIDLKDTERNEVIDFF